MTTDLRPLRIAAIASAGAGLVHAAAAGSHADDRVLAVLFGLAAAGQLGWAWLAVVRPSRSAAALGAALGTAMVLAWAASRTVGWPLVASMAEPSPAGTQDLVAVALAAVAAGVAFVVWVGVPVPARAGAAPVTAVLTVAVLGLSVPAMAAEHAHGDHGADDHAHGSDEIAHDDHAHDVVDAEAHRHDEDDAAHEDGHGHDEEEDGPIVSLDDPRLSAHQRDAAQALLDDVTAEMARFDDVASVEAAGYVSIGDGVTGFEHFTHPEYRFDPISMDPSRPESIVFRVHPDGSRELVSAMFILPPDRTMDDVPDIAGSLTPWHDHQDLCWSGNRVVGRILDDGTCRFGEFRPTAPMMHVWLVPHPCGPFAGIEGHGDGDCSHAH